LKDSPNEPQLSLNKELGRENINTTMLLAKKFKGEIAENRIKV
jgi:hypothetical protein